MLRVRQSKAFALHTFCILFAYFIKNIYIFEVVLKLSGSCLLYIFTKTNKTRFSQRKLKRAIWRNTFKMLSLFFFPRQPFRAEGMKTERWKEKTTKRGSGDGRSLRSRSF